ncbi:uncharacterized protein EV422DRAFT_605290 [Fimicolochytrium jonesii]|uniref:uncharacterized protein n=1 Tax=Fimicolochytrium jonesii TaxID=1396493 RepID=UPI0022FE496C|nr:uncharacterized protein EV422DRAFT_605290 [Fimicolochytrium jonesii]KAI8824882.1 hypothetical protein EV422DRAFT_605290 [Fimicolochytrium jonesii]
MTPPPPATADSGFLFTPPALQNQYLADPALQGILAHYLPAPHLTRITPDLINIGQRAVSDIAHWGDNAERHPPTLTQYDHWCRRVDRLETSEGWRWMKGMAAREGLVAIAYDQGRRDLGEHARIYQFAKLFIASPSMAMYSCPLAMTDGAARLVELYGTEEMKQGAFKRLTSRDPTQFWTSGQWMTERPGGSDVGGTETVAVKTDTNDNDWRVSGFKWFSSATDSDMTFLLARTLESPTHKGTPGSKGLSLFYSELRKPDGELNGIRIHRLKNKLGTRALPTAELELHNLPGTPIGTPNRGVATISVILNITRIYSAMGAASHLQRALSIAKGYAESRVVFGKRLKEQPLHSATLAEVALTLRGCTLLLFYAVKLLGESECSPHPAARQRSTTLLRLTTPLLKMYVCHSAVPAISEALEACGGQGYMEETGLARQLRDAQVNAIWEGTTNVQALDVLKIVATTFPVYAETVRGMVDTGRETYPHAVAVLTTALERIEGFVARLPAASPGYRERHARTLGFAMARVLIGALLVEHAVVLRGMGHGDAEASGVAVGRWCARVGDLVGGLGEEEEGGDGRGDDVLVYGRAIANPKL